MKTHRLGIAAGVIGAAWLLLIGSSLPVSAQHEASAHIRLDAFTAALNETVPAYLNTFEVPGAAVALIRNGEIVFARGYGYADVEKHRPVTTQTGFNIGSISKTVAAWGVMQLVEQGKIELDAPVWQYLTRWQLPPSAFDASGVTVRRLLSHTAGLSLHGYPGFGPDDELPTLEASLSGDTNGSEDVRLIMEPGTQWKYSGGGYTLLQLLVEEITGQSFAEYMQEAVLQPLGMQRSSYALTPAILAGSSLAYDEFGEPTPNPRFTAQAAAGLHTTVEDLATFAAAAVANPQGEVPGRGLLQPETVALMTTPAPASDSTYGLGYGVNAFHDDLLIVGHGGANRGWHAVFQIVPATGDGLVVVTNGSNGWNVHRQVTCDWMAWQTGSRPPCQVSIAAALVGTLKHEGVEAALQRYAYLKREHPDDYRFTEWELNRLGYGLLSMDRVHDAIAIFKRNVEEYPAAANPYDSLGEAYVQAGEKELAILNYQKSLELDPENTNAVRMLEELEEQ